MPIYNYRCNNCGYEFSEQHSMSDTVDECPECESGNVQRLIKSAPSIANGMITHAGDGKKATKEELRRKWQEETPKLRKKLRDKLGDDAVNNIPSLNHNDED